VFELVRLRAENVQAGPARQGAADLTVLDSSTELLSALRPTRVARGWRYSLVITHRHNDLFRDLRSQNQPDRPKEK
jgi:hypothetical protein